ncbi:MAG: D-alanine--D-alanine ligase [Planctomycetes bacterium]|nr:D-alanine--D-alanine ligase [Planctomycetota bacterium]
MSARRIAVLHSEDRELASGDRKDALAVQAAIDGALAAATSLRSRGYEVSVHGVPRDARAIASLLARLSGDLVLNFVESLGGDARLEAAFAWALELFGLAYTGSPPRAMQLATEKPLARALLAARGVPVPRGAVFATGDEPLGELCFPLLAKPAREDASHGIDQGSVVRDERALRTRAKELIARYAQPALIEEYIEAREINVALLAGPSGLEVLPLSEIDYSLFRPDEARIVTYAGKWIEGSRDWDITRVIPARDLSASQRARLESVARAAFEVMGLRDYGRVDLRLDARDEPYVIDVNPNPDLSPGTGFALAAERAGLDHAALLARVIEAARARLS